MKKVILITLVAFLFSGVAKAEEALSPEAILEKQKAEVKNELTVRQEKTLAQKAKIEDKLAKKQEQVAAETDEIEANLSPRQKQTLARIDDRIEKTRAAGKSTADLERRRVNFLKRAAAQEKRFNFKTEKQKSE